MQPRIAYTKVAPGAMKAVRGLEDYLAECGLEPSLLDLVRTRASQINGCAYCIDMHTKPKVPVVVGMEMGKRFWA